MHKEQSAVMTAVHRSSLRAVPLRVVHEFLHRAILGEEPVQEDFRCFVYLMDCEPSVESIARQIDCPNPQPAAELHLQDATGAVNGCAERFSEKKGCARTFGGESVW